MSVQSIERVFDIIELLSTAQDGMALTDISKGLDLHKSTVHRLMAVLRDRGYIDKHESSGRYRLGPRFVELTSLYLNNVEIKTEAEPYLRQLSQLVNRTCFIAVRHGWQVMYIDKYEERNSLRKYSVIGQRKPAYCTSLGKALLLDHTEAEIESLFAGVEFEPFTENTARSAAALNERMQQYRALGWTKDDEEEEIGIRCVGAPLRDYRGNIIAAISVSWFRTNDDPDFETVAPHVVDAAEKISHRIGYLSDLTGRNQAVGALSLANGARVGVR